MTRAHKIKVAMLHTGHEKEAWAAAARGVGGVLKGLKGLFSKAPKAAPIAPTMGRFKPISSYRPYSPRHRRSPSSSGGNSRRPTSTTGGASGSAGSSTTGTTTPTGMFSWAKGQGRGGPGIAGDPLLAFSRGIPRVMGGTLGKIPLLGRMLPRTHTGYGLAASAMGNYQQHGAANNAADYATARTLHQLRNQDLISRLGFAFAGRDTISDRLRENKMDGAAGYFDQMTQNPGIYKDMEDWSIGSLLQHLNNAKQVWGGPPVR